MWNNNTASGTRSIIISIVSTLLLSSPSSPSVTSALSFLTMSSSSPSQRPMLPIPKALDSLTPGTWAYDTMTRRIDSEILQRTYEENESEFASLAFAPAMVEFEALRNELRDAADTRLRHLRPIPGCSTEVEEEMEEWRSILAPYIDERADTWLSCPWMVAEFYLYRRLMEALGYFDPSSPNVGYDPFAKQKQMGLVTSLSVAAPILQQMEPFLHVESYETRPIDDVGSGSLEEGTGLAVAFALWGNKMDLSLWPADSKKGSETRGLFDNVLRSAEDNLLRDDSKELHRYIRQLHDRTSSSYSSSSSSSEGHANKRPTRVDIIVDNAGFELVMDLILADYLIASGIADTVRFQLKSHPTFVSDATESDLRRHVAYYAQGGGGGGDDGHNESSTETTKQAGRRWFDHLTSGRWECHEHSFWVQPPPMWEMPSRLRLELTSNCDLAFVKGDANYRRLLGDCEWDYVKDGFEDVVGAYFPCPVVALRTLKAEVGCGMDEEAVERVRSGEDKEWSVNGKYGVVQFSMGAGE